MNRNDRIAELGRLVAEQRRALGLTVTAAAERADITRETWSRIESTSADRLSRSSLDGVDVALEWPTGTAATIYARGYDALTYTLDDSLRDVVNLLVHGAGDDELTTLLVVLVRLVKIDEYPQIEQARVRGMLARILTSIA